MKVPVVLDLTRLLPGPLAGRILASLGFRVLRVRSPRGDLAETAAPELSRWLATDKQTETLDLKSDEGRRRLLALAGEADVLLESNLPGALERVGLGPEVLCAANPRLVYIRIAGFPPPHAGLPGHDLTYLAAAGLLTRLDTAWKHVQLADLCGAFWTVIATLEGLRKGGGFYQVHLADAFASIAYPQPPFLDGSALCYGVYHCADGKIALTALEPAMWSRFCEAVARADWIDLAFSPSAAHNPAYREVCELFLRRTAAEWDSWAEQNAVPLRSVRARPTPAPMPPWISR